MAPHLLLSLLLAHQEMPAPVPETASSAPAAEVIDDVEICRKRPVENPKARGRTKMVQICKTREEWKAYSARRT